MSAWKDISEFVLKNDYCCGCGVCAGLCPQNVLEMRFNEYGEYRPYLVGQCTDCGLCSKVCPFVRGNCNEDVIGRERFGSCAGVRRTPETGYYLDSYVGYAGDPDMRWTGASGGLLTWTLTTLLENDWIDYAVCVRPCARTEKLFSFVVCETPEEVRGCSKSCYYPVELSEVLSEMQTREGRCAIVGLPCALKALRRAEEINPRLKKRIAYHLGLVCGQQKGTLFAEYVCSLGGGNPRNLTSVSFRVKDRSRPASDFGLRFKCSRNGHAKADGVIYWTEGMKEAWCHGYFKLNACNYCDDLFAEVADAAYMDAWLPQYAKDPLGTNIVLVRHRRLLELLKAGEESNQIRIEHIDVEDVVTSQQGALNARKKSLAKRLAFARSRGLPIPEKRVSPSAMISFREKLKLRLEQKTAHASKVGFRIQKAVGKGLWLFRTWMHTRLLLLMILNWIARCGIAAKRRLVRLEDR